MAEFNDEHLQFFSSNHFEYLMLFCISSFHHLTLLYDGDQLQQLLVSCLGACFFQHCLYVAI